VRIQVTRAPRDDVYDRAMKLALALLLVTASVAHADEDPGMQLMTVMMRTPAISADGKHVAIYNEDPGTEKGAMTSLAIFGASGAVEQRISVVPPNTDAAKAKAAAAKLVTLLDDGGYKRMSRVARVSEKAAKTTYTTELKTEDVVIDVAVAKRKLKITGTRAGKKLAPISLTIPKDGPCKSVDAYGLANTMAGYDGTTSQLAFTLQAWQHDQVCFAHGFVVTLK
jgi:hypothetical protein